MRKGYNKFIFLLVVLLIMSISFKTYATSWAVLKPEEVINKADVIVIGKYDFSSKPVPGEFVFHGLRFNVETIYKGDVSKQLTAGIDYNDKGWVTDFQNKGGKFLLFLEINDNAEFLVPVAGPNGMVQILDGKVEDPNEERKIFYENYLKKQTEKTSVPYSETGVDDQNQKSKPYILLIIFAGVFVGLVVWISIYRYMRKK